MQMQMLLTKRSYCDFFVWSKGKENFDKLIVRADADISFQQELKAKLINVFEKVGICKNLSNYDIVFKLFMIALITESKVTLKYFFIMLSFGTP